ncbi:BLUF domain-containing protein [Wenzhouxiangella sp. EGI_FJ10305]|uniref:BLUF domain-containing protein n=1 Tax=Wenzhouxiangella sp. EGI_FJ10305 TaxID=3243768 RepID=UPI0035E348C2
MSELIELVYASRSNVARNKGSLGVEPEVGRILTQSRRNNEPRNIGGVLCFGNDIFFQCLEGEREHVEKLYNKLHDDPRHRDVTLLRKRPVESRRFKLWAMKYLTLDRTLRDRLQRRGHKEFDPFSFEEETIDEVLDLLKQSTEAPIPPGDRPMPEPPGDNSQLKVYTIAAAAVLVTFGVIAWMLL